LRAVSIARHCYEVVEGSCGEERSHQINTIRNSLELRTEDALCDPNEESDVEEYIYNGGVGNNSSNPDVEEVVSINHLLEFSSLLLPTLDHSNRTIHNYHLFN
jgi:hypothetical protein